MTNPLEECARIALSECLGLGRRERLLVVCDPPCSEIGDAFWSVGSALCREAVMVRIAPRKQNGNEPPQPVGGWFGQFDVAVMPTSRSLSHTQARRKASEGGTRIATLPGITADIFTRTMRADWKKLGIVTRRVAAQLSGASRIRITTQAGTDLSFDTGGRSAKPDDGRLIYKGAFGNFLPGRRTWRRWKGPQRERSPSTARFRSVAFCQRRSLFAFATERSKRLAIIRAGPSLSSSSGNMVRPPGILRNSAWARLTAQEYPATRLKTRR